MDKAPRIAFVTGFPGFIAERLVARLAREVDYFYLLVQPQFAEGARRSVSSIAANSKATASRFDIVEGDITAPDLGLSAEDLQNVRSGVTEVFHLAAVYDLAVPKDVAYAVNLDGTRNVNEFARSLPLLERYNYISTCYVAGKRTGRILETDLEHDAGFRNHYEETKYLAEMEVEKLKAELPVTIFRPSVVVGDSKTGETAKYDGIYSLINYLRRAPNLLRLINVGNRDVKLNLVPVDFVVEGIAALSSDEDALGKTIALADPDPLATSELFDAIAGNLSGKESVLTPPAKLTEWALMLPVSPAISGLPHPSVPYFFLDQTYDTSIADELLSKHRVACPNFQDYVGNLLRFVEIHPKL